MAVSLSLDPAPSAVVVQASVIRRRLGVLIDRLSGAGGFDPQLLAELEAFVHDQALPAARAYEAVLEARWANEATPGDHPCPKGCWKSDFTCPADQRFDELADELAAAGYAPHHNAVDAQMAATLACVCGGPLAYVGLSAPGSYRAFGVCRSCDHFIEF